MNWLRAWRRLTRSLIRFAINNSDGVKKISQILKRLFKYIGRVKSNDFLRKCISFNISITNVHQVDILFVKIDEPQYAKKNKIKTFPSVGLYRQGYNFS